MNGTESKYTVWHYVGCGCAVLFVLAVLGIGGCFWMMKEWGTQMSEELKDPEARAAKARSLLGYEELPEEYHPGISFSVPLVMDVVMLGDRELPAGDLRANYDDDDLFEKRGFLFFKMRDFGQGEEEMREELDHDFRPERVVAEGELEAGGATVAYVAEVGTAHVGSSALRSVTAELEIDCGDSYYRKAIWFTPVPGAEAGKEEEGQEGAPEEESFAGTPADEAALRAFLDHFDFCR